MCANCNKQKKMILILLYAMACFTNVYVYGTWTAKSLMSQWNINSLSKVVDTSLISATHERPTLTGCIIACSVGELGQIKSLFYIPQTKVCHCNSQFEDTPEDASVISIMYGELRFFQKNLLNEELSTRKDIWPSRLDCLSLRNDGFHRDGIYTINQWDGSTRDVQCDMTNGGWTVIQRRFDGSENFYRGWNDYKLGFGNVNGEYWIGLENIHKLTLDKSELSVYVEAYPGVNPKSATAHYDNFFVGDNTTAFRLDVSGYSGTCGNSLDWRHNGEMFTTYDRDNDRKRTNCAIQYKGAWWYRACHHSNLNGYYFKQGEYSYSSTIAQGIHWYSCWRCNHSAKKTEMKIRRL